MSMHKSSMCVKQCEHRITQGRMVRVPKEKKKTRQKNFVPCINICWLNIYIVPWINNVGKTLS